MVEYNISEDIKKAIENRETLLFRIKMDYDIHERILTPIGFTFDNSIILYSHTKKTYVGAGKEGTQSWTVIESKQMPGTSTIDNLIYTLIETLLKSGYTRYVKN